MTIPLPIPPRVSLGDAFSLLIPFNSFTDVDEGTILKYNITVQSGGGSPQPLSAVPWLAFDNNTRIISGTAIARGISVFSIIAYNPSGFIANGTFSLAVNSPPVAVRLTCLVESVLVWERAVGHGTTSDSSVCLRSYLGGVVLTDACLDCFYMRCCLTGASAVDRKRDVGRALCKNNPC